MRPSDGYSSAGPLLGSATGYVRQQLAGNAGRPDVLGAFRTALYLQLANRAVLAVLTADAVRLPIGLVLPLSSAELPLDRVRPGEVWLAGGTLRLDGRLAGLAMAAGPARSAALRPVGRPAIGLPALGHWQRRARAAARLPDIALDGVLDAPAAVVGTLLGRGPGLTPAGDDLLCGLLAGTVLFELAGQPLRQAVLDRLASGPWATTSLSRQLLLRAAAGEGIEQLTALAAALCQPDGAAIEPAWAALSAIGHSSGAALGLGLLVAAEHASQPVRVGR